MKIAKDRLKQLIKEELSLEGHGEADGSMAQQNLWKICEYAEKLKGIISSDQDLEPWVEEKIAVAAYIMDSVGHYMEFEAEGGGEEEYSEEPPSEEFGDDEEGFDDEEDIEFELHEELEEGQEEE
jgi:hypothetical protein